MWILTRTDVLRMFILIYTRQNIFMNAVEYFIVRIKSRVRAGELYLLRGNWYYHTGIEMEISIPFTAESSGDALAGIFFRLYLDYITV